MRANNVLGLVFSNNFDNYLNELTSMRSMGSVPYGSPTLSNQALVGGIPTLKMGPGDTVRSHTANEYVLISEIRDGIEKFCAMFDGLRL